jgi:hypothetical protein
MATCGWEESNPSDDTETPWPKAGSVGELGGAVVAGVGAVVVVAGTVVDVVGTAVVVGARVVVGVGAVVVAVDAVVAAVPPPPDGAAQATRTRASAPPTVHIRAGRPAFTTRLMPSPVTFRADPLAALDLDDGVSPRP